MPLTSAEIERKLFDMNDIIQELEPFFKLKRPVDVCVKIRFPRGVIPKAESVRSRLPIIRSRILKTNISYALQFSVVYLWMLRWFDLDWTAKQMLIKHGIILFTSVSEALTHHFVDNYLPFDTVNKRFKKNLEKLLSNGVIGDDEFRELDRCRKIRDNIHLQNQFVREWEEYEENDFHSASVCMSRLNTKLTIWVRQHSR
jgi:hypothetical protein